MITNPKVEAYLQQQIPERSPVLQELEHHAEQEHIPIIQLPAAQFLRTMLMVKQPQRILEIGTATGYSALWMAEAVPQAHITTLEKDAVRAKKARQAWEQAKVSERITLIEGDALEGLPEPQSFDCIFMDAAKGQYRAFFDLYFPMLQTGGLLVCDNVLFRGMVAEEEPPPKRFTTMIHKLKQFNLFLAEHPALDVSMVPIGDGITIAIKKETSHMVSHTGKD